MTRNIDRFVPPMALFHVWGADGNGNKGFSDAECDKIAKFGELALHQQGDNIGHIGGDGGDGGYENPEIRKSPVGWIQPKDDTFWIFERMNAIVAQVNFAPFQLDLTQFDGFQYTKYKAPGGHFTWHTDTVLRPPHGLFRKLSCVLMLSDPDEYEGGDLELNIGGDQEKAKKIRLKKGEIVFFYSHIPHRVTPVTKGVRLTLVTWAMGPKPC